MTYMGRSKVLGNFICSHNIICCCSFMCLKRHLLSTYYIFYVIKSIMLHFPSAQNPLMASLVTQNTAQESHHGYKACATTGLISHHPPASFQSSNHTGLFTLLQLTTVLPPQSLCPHFPSAWNCLSATLHIAHFFSFPSRFCSSVTFSEAFTNSSTENGILPPTFSCQEPLTLLVLLQSSSPLTLWLVSWLTAFLSTGV